MTERFLRATALAGDMHVIDLKDWDPVGAKPNRVLR